MPSAWDSGHQKVRHLTLCCFMSPADKRPKDLAAVCPPLISSVTLGQVDDLYEPLTYHLGHRASRPALSVSLARPRSG